MTFCCRSLSLDPWKCCLWIYQGSHFIGFINPGSATSRLKSRFEWERPLPPASLFLEKRDLVGRKQSLSHNAPPSKGGGSVDQVADEPRHMERRGENIWVRIVANASVSHTLGGNSCVSSSAVTAGAPVHLFSSCQILLQGRSWNEMQFFFFCRLHTLQRVNRFRFNGHQVKIILIPKQSACSSAHPLDLTQLDPDFAYLQPTDSLPRTALEHVCSSSAACPPTTRLASLHANPFLPQRVDRML